MKAYRDAFGKKLAAEQAVQWLCDLRDGDNEEQEAFFAWLKESPQHVKEFLVATAVWNGLDRVGASDAEAIERAVAEARTSEAATNVVALPRSHGTATLSPPKGPSSSALPARPLRWATAFGALAVSAVLGWWFVNGASTYHTAIGEQRAVRLADGSVLYLNTESRARVRFSERARNVQLLEGEALFQVAHDAARPFFVSAGAATIQAVGTQFNVYRQENETKVAVIEGVVRLSADARKSDDALAKAPAAGSQAEKTLPAMQTLGAGEEASVTTRGRIVKDSAPEVAAAVAWRQRRLVFRGNTLAEVTAEFNRYSQHSIRVEGETARNKRLAGTFNADDPESLVQFLAQENDLLVERSGDDLIIRAR